MTTPAYHYSNTATTTALVASINSGATVLTVETISGYPGDVPWVAKIDGNTPSEELVKVTAAAGEVLTVERAFGGTSAQAHAAGAEFKHVYNAVDAADFRDHEASAESVHGVTGDLVGTGNTQTLTNKTLASPVINSGTLNGSYGGEPVFEEDVAHQGEVSITRPDAGDAGLEVRVTGDDHPRVRITAGGTIFIGSGTAEPNIQLRRDTSVLETPNITRIVRPASGDNALQVRVDDDTVSRLLIAASGALNWGPGGGAALDTNLYRAGANLLKTDDNFESNIETAFTGITAPSGWTIPTQTLRRTGRWARITFQVERTGSNISPNAAGNITDVQVATIPSGWRIPEVGVGMASDHFGHGAAIWLTTGAVQLVTWNPGGTIQPGRTIRISTSYLLT